MLIFVAINRLPSLRTIRACLTSFIVDRRKHTHGFQREKKGPVKKHHGSKASSLMSFINSVHRDESLRKLLCMGFNNDVESIIYLLQEYLKEGIQPKLHILKLVAHSLCYAQSKEGVVLASLLAHQNFPYFYKCMSNFEVFHPVQWNSDTFNHSVSHFEMMYTKVFPAAVGKSFRASLISCYLYNGIRTEFLDLYYFVNDAFYYWKDVQPLTALWEVLFCSPEEEDQAHAHNLLKSNRKQIVAGMRSCLISFIITLANLGDTETLFRLAELIENKTLHSREVRRLYPNLKQLIIDMKYNEGRLDESILLMASGGSHHLSVKRNDLNGLGLRISNKKENSKLYFADLLSIEETMLIPIPLLHSNKVAII